MEIFEKIKGKVSSVFKEAMNSGIPAVVGFITMIASVVISQSAVVTLSIIKIVSEGWFIALQVFMVGGLLSVVVGITLGCLFGWITSCIISIFAKFK